MVRASDRPVVYADFNCPFCFALCETLAKEDLDTAVDWCCIQHAPDLPIPAGVDRKDTAEIAEEIARLRHRASGIEVAQPPYRPNSGPATLIAAEAALADDPALPQFRLQVFRALWLHGHDISDPDLLEQLVRNTELRWRGAVTDRAKTLAARWQHQWESGSFDRRIPVMVSARGGALLGFPDQERLELFLKSGLFSSRYSTVCQS